MKTNKKGFGSLELANWADIMFVLKDEDKMECSFFPSAGVRSVIMDAEDDQKKQLHLNVRVVIHGDYTLCECLYSSHSYMCTREEEYRGQKRGRK